MSHLSDDELRWVNCYNEGDTVLFESDSLIFDTLVVESKDVDNSEQRFYIHYVDNYKGDKRNAFARYTYYIKGYCDSIYGFFKMTKLVENDSIAMSTYLEDRFSDQWEYDIVDWNRLWRKYIGENPIKVTSMLFKGKKLDNCIIINASNSQPAKYLNGAEPKIESFVINRDYGLIYYKYTNGKDFFRKMD